MSNNARVVAGGEIGSAQYFQALAARAEPDVRMNPLLLKPERDTHSQVVLMGQVDEALTRTPWRGRSASVWPVVSRALDELRAEKLAHRALDGQVQEVILATNFTPEGETTAHALGALLKGHGLQLSRMARGLPVGGELEHSDPGTLAQALFERRELP